MTVEDSVFFEGTEKKLELVVSASSPPLRGLGDRFWNDVVESSGARVLSKLSSPGADAYLLSESSLFVFDRRVLMITCGRTRLVDSLRALLRRVPAAAVASLIYERKNEAFPHDQPTSFFDDVRDLEVWFPGKAYKFGDEGEHHLYLYHLDRLAPDAEKDVTVEVLMYGLDEEVAALFRGDDRLAPAVLRRQTGIDRILPGYATDDYCFEPDGYSINALSEDRYWALHVTPNELHSYGSFETNHDVGACPMELVRQVVECFRPRSFDLVLFHGADRIATGLEGYTCRSRVREDLSCGYRVRFLSYFAPQAGVSRPLELPIP